MNGEGLRRSSRTPPGKEIPHRHKELFHGNNPAFGKKLELIHKNPNVYYVKNFLSEREILMLDRICTMKRGEFNSSFVENDENQEVISEMRTSKYVYINKAHSVEIRTIEERAATLSGLDVSGVEPLQIVSYTQGQKFETHHDAGTLLEDGSVIPVPPRRLTTLFLYLNSLPEGQGHTEFPALGISVKPERGCGVLFSNVNCDGSIDPRTQHRAAPVAGALMKYGVNIWMTDTNFQELASAGVKGAVTAKELKDFFSKNEITKHNNFPEVENPCDVESQKNKANGRGGLRLIESALQRADRATRNFERLTNSTEEERGGVESPPKRRKAG